MTAVTTNVNRSANGQITDTQSKMLSTYTSNGWSLVWQTNGDTAVPEFLPVGTQAPIPPSDYTINSTGRITTDQTKMQATYTGWDFTTSWAIDEGASYPYDKTAGPTLTGPPTVSEPTDVPPRRKRRLVMFT